MTGSKDLAKQIYAQKQHTTEKLEAGGISGSTGPKKSVTLTVDMDSRENSKDKGKGEAATSEAAQGGSPFNLSKANARSSRAAGLWGKIG